MCKDAISPISVIILTLNEEANIQYALRTVDGWTDDIHIVDSGSSDKTIDIAKQFQVNIHEHEWTNWAGQRNWALDNIDIKYNWVLFLDADEQLTADSAAEIVTRIKNASDDCVGFYLLFDFYFLGKYIRNAMVPHLRLIRKDVVRWKNVGAREYCDIDSDNPSMESRLVHYDHKPLSYWIKKQLRNAELEAKEKYLKRRADRNVIYNKMANKKSLKIKLRDCIDVKVPLFLSPFIFFVYKLMLNINIYNFSTSVLYAFLLGFWYPFMIDVKYVKIWISEKDIKDQ